MKDEKTIKNKILKCMKLGQSDNPNEAAAAIKRAQQLMDKYGLSQDDVELSQVKEITAKSGKSNKPPIYVLRLINIICGTFGVNYYLSNSWKDINFIGIEVSAEIASYAFTVLRRQLTASRQAYYKRTRGKRINRIIKADSYAVGWCIAIEQKVKQLAKPLPPIVDLYEEQKLNLTTSKAKTRKLNNDAAWSGHADGSKVDLFPGMEHKERLLENGKNG